MTGRSLRPLLTSAGASDERTHVVFGRERHTAGRPGGVGYPARGIRTDGWAYLRNLAPERWPAGDPPLYADCDPARGRGEGITKGVLLTYEHADVGREYYEWSFAKRPREELYDVERDPHQLVNRADDPEHAERKAALAALLDAELAATGDPRAGGAAVDLDSFPYFGGGVWDETVAFANGLKIGEVGPGSAVLWTRLTRHPEALARIDAWDPARPHWRVPSAPGQVRFAYARRDAPEAVTTTAWQSVDASSDGCLQVRLEDLAPATEYVVEAHGRVGDQGDPAARFEGSFQTAPAADDGRPVSIVVSTCQDFPRRDEPDRGHRIYRSMLGVDPDFFVQTGDTVYYDKPEPFARDVATARYKWNRLYALPNQRAFHARVPSYWIHDDHDTLKNDCWPGQRYGDLTFEQGLSIWREQTPQSERPYRSFRWGRHLQVWFPEGREYRSPNTRPDGPGKTILGAEQWRWLERSLAESDATFKLFVSATPVVGPDRESKNDNHANSGFAYEGERLRALLADTGALVVCGDRHWQYHSIDPDSGLQEFACGPASDEHAGGFRPGDQAAWQPYLRIAGGFLSIEVRGDAATLRHHDVDGAVVYTVELAAPR